MKDARILVTAAFLLATSASAVADVIGVPVDGVGSTTPVGLVSPSGVISFFIPLSGDGATAVNYSDTVGVSSDSCVYGANCGGGLLAMTLYFNPVQDGPATLSLLFKDLDIDGVNDPSYFIETLEIRDGGGGLIDTIDLADLSIANDVFQLIELPVSVTSQPDFYVTLIFGAEFDGLGSRWNGTTFSNTKEKLLAKVVGVPEPSALAMLGIGLLFLAGIARRRRAQATSSR